MMRILSFAIALMLAFATPVRASTLKAAVFDFELFDTSLEGEKNGRGPMNKAGSCVPATNCARVLRTPASFSSLTSRRSNPRRRAATFRRAEVVT